MHPFIGLAVAAVIEFHIPAGSARASWNTKEAPVRAQVGDTLRLINDDDTAHELHTDGAPCPHGDDIAPQGGTYDCVLTLPYDALREGPLRDHYNAFQKFWVVVTEPAREP